MSILSEQKIFAVVPAAGKSSHPINSNSSSPDSNGCQFHARDGVNGYVVKSNDREALVSALYKIINRKTLNQLKVGALEYTKNEENFLKQFKLLTSRIKVN